MLRLSLLGDLSLTDGDRRLAVKRPLLVLAALAMSPNGRMPRDRVARLIWPHQRKERAATSLRQARMKLRGWSEQADVTKDGDYLALPVGMSADLWDAEEALERGDARAAIELRAGPVLEPALGSLRGEFRDQVDTREEHLKSRMRAALRSLIATGMATEAAELAASSTRIDSLDEEMHEILILARFAAGDPHVAVADFEGFRATLDKLDDQPSSQLVDKVERLRPLIPAPVAGGQTLDIARANWRARALLLPVAVAAGVVLSSARGGLGFRDEASQWPMGAQLTIPTLVGLDVIDITIVGKERSESDAYRLPVDYAGRGSSGLYARKVDNADTGFDLVVGMVGGEEWIAVAGEGDEKPIVTEPLDGGVLYRWGRLSVDGGYKVGVRFWSLADSTDVLLRDMHGPVNLRGSWSDSRYYVALTVKSLSEAPDTLVIMRPDGEPVFTEPMWLVANTAWAPGSHVLAVVERVELADRIRLMGPDGSDLGTLSELQGGMVSGLAWLTGDILLISVDFGLGGDLWTVRRSTNEISRITYRADVTGIATSMLEVAPRRWLDDVPVAAWSSEVLTPSELWTTVERFALVTPRTVARGEYFEIDGRLRLVNGRETAVNHSAIQWMELPSFLSYHGLGTFRAAAFGRGSVSARLMGSIDARVDLSVLPTTTVDSLPVLFSETWRQPRAVSRSWTLFGDPRPAIDSDKGVFAANGDGNHPSGAVSTATFSLEDGLTIEVRAQIPYDGGIHQGFVLGLVEFPPADSTTVGWTTGWWTQVNLGAQNSITRPFLTLPLERPEGLAEWHRYALQIDTDGAATFVIDGNVYRRSTPAPLPPAAYVYLGASSVGADVLHGDVVVYAGTRYQVR